MCETASMVDFLPHTLFPIVGRCYKSISLYLFLTCRIMLPRNSQTLVLHLMFSCFRE
jgi:hypothetical protein